MLRQSLWFPPQFLVGGGTPTPSPAPSPSQPSYTFGQYGLNATIASVAGTSNTKSTPTSLGTLTSAIDGFQFQFVNQSTRACSVDIGIGPSSGSVTWFVQDLLTGANGFSRFIPIAVASGQQLWFRFATNSGSTAQALAIGAVCSQAGFSFSTLTALGSASAPATPGVVLDLVTPAWVPIGSPIATAGKKAFYLGVGNNQKSSSRTPNAVYVDIGIGAPGSEVVLFTIMAYSTATAIFADCAGPMFVDLPAGTQVSLRGTHSAAPVSGTGDSMNAQVAVLA